MPDVFTAGTLALNVTGYDIEERCGQHDLLTVTGTGKNMGETVGKPA